jgi:glycerol uptake facilitator protein
MPNKTLFGECVAEFIGSWILLFIGASNVAAVIINGQNMNLWEISIVWGLGITMAIYITGAVSGTHINPAVTLALAVFRGFPWNKVLPYVIAQVLGCFSGAATAYFLYKNGFAQWEAANNVVRGSVASLKTASVFSTYPISYLSQLEAFYVEFVITALLIMVVFAVTDEHNPGAPKGNMAALMIGLYIALIGGATGTLTGFAMNPARDFGPKLFAMLAGWGTIAFGVDFYAWVPIVGPVLGGLAGAFVYERFVRVYLLPAPSQNSKEIGV